jgi:hypothetical protein
MLPLPPTARRAILEAFGLKTPVGVERMQSARDLRVASAHDPCPWRGVQARTALPPRKAAQEVAEIAALRERPRRKLEKDRDGLVGQVTVGLGRVKAAYAYQDPHSIFLQGGVLRTPVHRLRVVLQALGDKGTLPYRANQFRGAGPNATLETLAWADSLDTWLLAEGIPLRGQALLSEWEQGPAMRDLDPETLRHEAKVRADMKVTREQALGRVEELVELLRKELATSNPNPWFLADRVRTVRLLIPLAGLSGTPLPPHRAQFEVPGVFVHHRRSNFITALEIWLAAFELPPTYPAALAEAPRVPGYMTPPPAYRFPSGPPSLRAILGSPSPGSAPGT